MALFAGGGLGFIRSSVDIPEVQFLGIGGGSASNTDLGLHLVGGAHISVSPQVDLVPEVKIGFGGVDAVLLTIGALFNTQ